jgi:hypothetical protein
MSKLLKSKILLGVVIVAVMFVASAVVKTSSAAADCSITTTLRVGSTGAEVSCLQAVVGATADGKFGPMTKTSVMAWQSSHGLVADGVFGAKSRAVFNAGGAVSGNFPAGCTSASGFSSTTGLACTAVASGACTGGALFNSVTGASCSASLPAGCTTTAGFSPTTGAACSTGGVPAPSGAGDLVITTSTAGLDTEVLEGAVNTPVLSFKAQASGSSINVNNVKVSLTNTDTGGTSTRLERYASEVSVYMGTTKVGSALVGDFTKSGTTYTKNITITGATVAVGSTNKQTFWIDITALPAIDSADLSGDNWVASVDSTRWSDGTGALMTDTTSIKKGALTDETTGFSFSSLASGDLKLTVSKGAGSPIASNVMVSSTTTTDVLVNEFKLKATGSKMTVNSITLTVATNGTIANITNDMVIKVGGVQVAANDTVIGAGTELFTLDTPMDIAAGATVTFDVYAKVNKVATGFTVNGNNLTVDYTTANVEDVNGDTIPAGNRSGTALGEAQTFFTEGLAVKVISATNIVNAVDGAVGAAPDVATFQWVLDLTAFGDKDVYVNGTAAKVLATGDSATDVEDLYAVDNTGTALTGVTKTLTRTGSNISTVSGDASVYNGVYNGEGLYKILANTTGRVTITVTGTNAADAKQVAAHLTGVEWTTDYVEDTTATYDGTTRTIQSYTTNLVDDSQTPYVYVN